MIEKMSGASPDGKKPMNEIAVAVRNVTKVMGVDQAAKVAVENCSFEIEQGKFTVLIGPSGCGKTTLINMIAGYDAPTSGEILCGDVQVRQPGPDRLVVFQETMLFPWMTTLENVMYGPTVQRRRRKREIKKAAVDLLTTVGLREFQEKYPMQLSGGMQRRAELARALINDPKVLLMDEAFRGLDAMTRELMQVYLLELFEHRSSTVLFVTSEIDEAILLADRVVILSAGPCRVKSVLQVDLPRPRVRSELLGRPEFAVLKRRALELLYNEAKVAFTEEALARLARTR